MRILIAIGAIANLLAFSTAALAEATPAAPVVTDVKMTSGGWAREYLFAAPQAHDKKLPVVFIFHGMGGQAKYALVDYGWAELAQREGFIAAAPQGLPVDPSKPSDRGTNPTYWNANPTGGARTASDPINDVQFVGDMLADLEKKYAVDTTRVYATGMSNGAGMTNRLGDEMPSTFAAIAPVAGNNWGGRPVTVPLPVLMIFGRADPLVPIQGGAVKLPWGTVQQEAPLDSANRWAKLLSCGASTNSKSGPIETFVWQGCPTGTSLKMLVVDGMGHVWPGLPTSGLPESEVGPQTKNYDATHELWAFFREQHR
jgi:polyhydroxybutyrate depolymerase